MPQTVLEVKDLKIHFFTDEGVVRAVDGIDLTVERGKTVAPCLAGRPCFSGIGQGIHAAA